MSGEYFCFMLIINRFQNRDYFLARPLRYIRAETTKQKITNHTKTTTIMKKFSVYAVLAMGVLTVSSAAFAGTTTFSSRGFINAEVSDTVVPKDTVLPENTESASFCNPVDTVVPTDTVAPQKDETTPVENGFYNPVDTVVPTDTVAPQKEEATPAE